MTAQGQSPGLDSCPLTILVLSLMPQMEVVVDGVMEGGGVAGGRADGVLKVFYFEIQWKPLNGITVNVISCSL